MTKPLIFEELIERKNINRMRREDKAIARIERAEAQQERAVARLGQIVRNGRTVFYTFPAGGEYRESINPIDLI